MNQLNSARSVAACFALIGLGSALIPGDALGCACGCGIFDVGTASMFPSQQGAMLYAEYDYMDQNKNWSGTSQAPADNNSDKRIRTSFINIGAEYQFDSSWGALVEIPYWQRTFNTLDSDGVTIDQFKHGALGDIRLKAIYTGLASDLSTGLTLGVKLPTGDSSYANFDPDTEISTGSTDLLVGAYHLGNITQDAQFRYFAQAQWDQPVHSKQIYKPGQELVASLGGYYEGWNLGADVRVAPILQTSVSYRGHDGGDLGHPGDSGYIRMLVTPGIEADFKHLTVYADVGLPVYVNSSGNQLVASQFYRFNVSYRF